MTINATAPWLLALYVAANLMLVALGLYLTGFTRALAGVERLGQRRVAELELPGALGHPLVKAGDGVMQGRDGLLAALKLTQGKKTQGQKTQVGGQRRCQNLRGPVAPFGEHHRLVVAPHRPQRLGPDVRGIDMVGRVGQRLIGRLQRLVGPAQFQEQRRAVGPDIRRPAVEGKRPLAARQAFGMGVPEPGGVHVLLAEAVEQAQLKPVPQMLVKGLAVRQMPLPSFQVSVPFEGGGADQAGVEAADSTPKSQYIQKVTQAVEKKWQMYRALGREVVLPGSLLVKFYVNKEGKVEDLKRVEDKESNDWLNDITARAIHDAEIPPMPPEVFEMLPAVDKQRLKIEYNVLIY